MIAANSTSTTGAALERAGWRQNTQDDQFGFALPGHDARLRPADGTADWEVYALTAPRLRPPTAARALRANAALAGPAKWVAGADGKVWCRADVPREWISAGKRCEGGFGTPGELGPQQVWAAALTALATGQPPAAAVAVLDLDAACDLLKRSGRSASIDEGLLRVHVQLPDLYREICVTHGGDSVSRIVAELIDLTDLTGPSRRAAYAFAGVANRRLPLVRLSLQRRKGSLPLLAEVVFRDCGSGIPAAWIATAVEAVEAAIELCARELAALADPALAEHVLAAMAATNPQKECYDACENP